MRAIAGLSHSLESPETGVGDGSSGRPRRVEASRALGGLTAQAVGPQLSLLPIREPVR